MTAAAARAAGFAARSADGDVDDLAALVIAAHRPGAGAFLHVRGRHAAGDLVGRLAAAGVPARAAEIYDQAPRPIDGPGAGAARRRRARRRSPSSRRGRRGSSRRRRGPRAGRSAAATAVSLSRGGRRRPRRPRVRPPAGGGDAGAGRDARRARVGPGLDGVNLRALGRSRCDAGAGGHRLVPPGGLA